MFHFMVLVGATTLNTASAQTVAADALVYETGDVLLATYENISGAGTNTFIAIARTDMPDDEYSWWHGIPFAIDGTVEFDHLPAGAHMELRIYKDDGLEIMARSPEFSVEMAVGVVSSVTPDKGTYLPGEDHTFTWVGAPGYYYDWIGVAVAESIAADYVGFAYTLGDYDGTVLWSDMDHSAGGLDDLPPGDYEVRGYVNDAFDIWAHDDFSIALPDDWPSTVTSDKNLYTPSEVVTVCWTGAPGNALDWVGVAKRSLPSTELYSYTDVDGSPLWDYTDGLVDGCTTFSSTKVLGQYAARAFENDTYIAFANQDLFTVNFEPANPATPAQGTISSDLLEYTSGEPIEATWEGLPGGTHDFVALAEAGSSSSDPAEILWWDYTDGTDSGSVTIYSLLDGGSYVLRAYADDSFTVLAESDAFTVVLDPDQLPKVYSIPVCIVEGTPELYVAYENTRQGADAWVGIFDADAPEDAFSWVWSYVGGASEASAMFPVGHLPDGDYEIRLLSGRRAAIYSSPLTVDHVCPVASLSADQAWYNVGEPIELSFSGLNAHPHEFVGLLFDGLDPTSGLYSESVQVYPDNSGTAVLTAAEGVYRAHAFLDPDGTSLANTDLIPVCPVGEVPDCLYNCVDDDLIPPFACTGDTAEPPVPFGGTLLINEILTDPIAVDGDANCDGTSHTSEDEFIELVNTSNDLAVNLSLATISDSFGPRHVFSPGTVLGPGETMVVFGGGTPTFDGSLAHPWCAPFGADVEVQVATTGLLGFNNNGDTVTVANVDGVVLDTHTWSAEGNFDQSLVRKPELTFSNFVFHTTMPFTAARFSPGTRAGGGGFADPPPDTSGPSLPVDGLINEVLADPDLVLGDANCDGVVSTTQDEFVEIVNHTASTVDLSGARIEDEFGPRHVFAQGTEIVAGGAIVVFGGGTPTFDGSNGSAWCGPLSADVQTAVASSGALGLSNSGDTASILDVDGVLIDSLTWGSEGNDNQSLNRQPEITEGAPTSKHLDMPGATTRQSPGRRAALGDLSGPAYDTASPDPGETGDTGGGGGPPPAPPSWLQAVINEMLIDPDPFDGDANCDGVVSATQDEFVEIVNNGAVPMDLSLVVLSDGVLARHQFPPGTLVEPDGAIVVFGGGTPSIDGDPDETWCTPLPANVIVMTASSGALGLSNAGDTVTLTHGVDVIDTLTFGGEGANNQSLVRATEGDTDAALVQHLGVVDSIGPQSPGRGADGLAFDGSSDVDLPPPPPPDPVVPTLVINEVLADPPPANGDANCDGVNSTTQDEFVEIVNYGNADQDLSGGTLSDATGVRHTFAGGTILEPGETIVVFAGGAVSFDGSPALAWCNAWPSSVTGVISTTGALGLNNTGDTVTLKNASGTVLDTMTYGAEGGNDTSLNRVTELDPLSVFAKHNTLSAHSMSPGRYVDQTDFLPDPYTHTITVDGFSSDWIIADEQFDTTGGGTANYVTWSASTLYVGTFNGDVNFGGNQHWFVVYLGDDQEGTTGGITHNTQRPELPFEARYLFRWKADNSYNSMLAWNGASWVETAFWFGTGGSQLAERNDESFMEMGIPFAALSSLGTDINVHVSWLYEGSFFESTYSGSPFDSFVNGAYDPNFSTFLAFDLTSPDSPDEQSGP